MKIKSTCQKICFTIMVLLTMVLVTNGFTESSPASTPPRGDFIERFDKDHDGQVSLDEFTGPEEHFTHLDQNSDGYIEESEKPTGPPKGKRGNNMNRLDKDGDGKVSQDEFPGPDEHFTHFDQNSDGYLEESELPKGPPKSTKVKQ